MSVEIEGHQQDCSPVVSRRWDIQFDEGRNPRAKIGFVLIPNEQTIEDDMVRWAPDGIGIYFSRVLMPHVLSPQSLAKCGATLAEAAHRILPDDKLDVICFACTSGSVAVGEEKTLLELKKGQPGATATSLVSGVCKALRAFGARKIAIGTPYTDELNTKMAAYFEGQGFEIAEFQGLGLQYDRDMIRVAPDYLIEFAKAVDVPDAEVFLMSCGALRTIEVVDKIEQALGKPVVASNQAMLWDCLRLAGVEDRLAKLGRLFREH
ncbi:arylmalonate decarboxylase [Roseibium denhamense]|uniref:Maleate isomerase n=1 Tax=Roseibium denhamense TaxID=76305 RepID=A0ABY1N5U1_9HYPH|nr:arylmalonate decarboxylase [Roseibium denhamense]MTI04651.1 arylmalonate decarboxylase [Roseibium denhamense]SMP00402.1 maleate isomerase [Roseibium denhamense]